MMGYDSVEHGRLLLSIVWQVMAQYIMIDFDKIEYDKLWLNTVKYFMTQCSMMGYDSVQYDRFMTQYTIMGYIILTKKYGA